jgi:hypothetical protein
MIGMEKYSCFSVVANWCPGLHVLPPCWETVPSGRVNCGQYRHDRDEYVAFRVAFCGRLLTVRRDREGYLKDR